MAKTPEELENAFHSLFWYFGKSECYEKTVKPLFSFFSPPLTRILITLGIGGVVLKYWLLPYVVEKMMNHEYRKAMKIAREVREDELESIREEIHQLKNDQKIKEIIELIKQGPMAVYNKLQDGSIKPTNTVVAYHYYMCIAQDKTNCLTAILTDAYGQAEQLEKDYLGKAKPKLYGVIFSVKDMFDLEGRNSTVGLAKYLNQPKARDCVLAQVLKKQGAIIIAKTGCSQTLLSYGSGNPIYGTVNNPNSLSRSAGGSSSGEGALLALNGSMAGIGSDLGGSVRIPAHFCGICSLRPMNGRLSTKDVLECVGGYRGIESTYGFLGRDVNMLAQCYAAVLNDVMFKLDPQVPPIPWKQEIYESKRPLRIGYFLDDGYFTPTPGVQRAVECTVNALRDCGHTLVPFTIPQPWRVMKDFLKLSFQDGGIQLMDQLYAEDLDPAISPRYGLLKSVRGNYFQRLLLLLSLKRSSKRAYEAAQGFLELQRPYDLTKLFIANDKYKEMFFEMWQNMELDALVCPATGTPALPPDIPGKLPFALSYTTRFNYLDMPSGIVPVTCENEADQIALAKYPQDDAVYQLTKEAVTGAIGMPIGVQCASLPFQEEVALRVMRDVQDSVGRDMFMRAPLLA